MAKQNRFIPLLVLLCLTLTASSCTFITIRFEPEPDLGLCPIEDLLLNVSDFPGDQWYELGSRSYRDAPARMGIEKIGTGFTMTTGGASENVYRFRNAEDAAEGLSEEYALRVRLVPDGAEWYDLEYPSDREMNANDYSLECWMIGENQVRKCWYIARYDETVIEFHGYMIGITDTDLFNIIETLDSKAVTCAEGRN